MSQTPPQARKLLLGLDLGNTRLGCGVFEGEELLLRWSLPASELTEDPEVWDQNVPEDVLDAIQVALLSSVNPRRAVLVRTSLERRLGKPPLVLGRDVPVPVPVEVDRPEEVGTDRLLNVLAAFDRCRSACLIVDLGTALTVDVCSSQGAYRGGVIAPGMHMASSALHSHTALLPRVQPKRPATVTGRNTVECIRSGIFWGTVATIEGLIQRLRDEQPDVKRVFATGGGVSDVAAATSVIDEVVPDLHLEGVRLVAQSAGLAR